MKTTINGQKVTFEPHADLPAIGLIREQLGLTGTKGVCGAGICGACTILVDGVRMTSCLLPADRLAGKSVQTIEHFGEDNLHPIQRAFMVHDGLQCGFCTPGFIMSAIGFFEQWRRENRATPPTRDDVAEALAGNLCRCGAYQGIYEAVQRACTGEYDEVANVRPQRVDALEKVTGRSRYTADIHYDGQLFGQILRSPHAYARVVRVNLEKARAMDGIRAAVAFPLPQDTVRYAGQEVAAVAAVNRNVAARALDAIEVEYEVMEPITDIDAALASDAPEIWPRQARGNAPSAAEAITLPGRWKGNRRQSMLNAGGLLPGRAERVVNRQGDALRRAGGEYENEAQVHTTLEPHCCVARWQGHDRLLVDLSTQSVLSLAEALSEHFDLPRENVTVNATHVGGGFGSKQGLTMEAVAAVTLAREANAPVKVALNRAEEITAGGYRPGGQVAVRLAVDDRNQLKAFTATSHSNAGTAISNTVVFTLGPVYPGAPRSLVDLDVVTNAPPGRPFRGPGGPPALWALEQTIDQLAHDLDVDPVALRRQWDEGEIRQKLYNWTAQLPAWRARARSGEQTGRFRRGVGVAFGLWSYFYDAETEVQVDAGPGGFTVTTASQDIGNGTRTVLARAVADVLRVQPEEVNVKLGKSDAVHGPTVGGSRVTNSIYAPATEAATKVRHQLLADAAAHFSLINATVGKGGVDHRDGHLPWSEVLAAVPPRRAIAVRGADPQLLQQLERRIIGLTSLDLQIGQGQAHAATVAEVEVDTWLGKTRVTRVWENIAAGKIHLPDMARSQVYGAIIQGVGYALYEEKVMDARSGAVLTRNLDDYRIPGIGDTPEMHVEFIEEGFEHVRGGGIGLSELATVQVGPAIANAIFNATGFRPTHSPITPRRLLEGLTS